MTTGCPPGSTWRRGLSWRWLYLMQPSARLRWVAANTGKIVNINWIYFFSWDFRKYLSPLDTLDGSIIVQNFNSSTSWTCFFKFATTLVDFLFIDSKIHLSRENGYNCMIHLTHASIIRWQKAGNIYRRLRKRTLTALGLEPATSNPRKGTRRTGLALQFQ